MKKSILIAGALLALGASNAASAAGINLSWDDCGLAGVANKAFGCNTNAGADILVASFDPPAGLSQFIGVDARIDIRSGSGDLPAWWKTTCRTVVSPATFSSDVLATCADPYAFPMGSGALGITEYNSSPGDPAEARVRVAAAVQPSEAHTVNPNTEYYAFFLNVRHAVTTPETCTGCLTPMCIVLNEIELVQPSGTNPRVTNARDRQHVTFQGGTATPPNCPLSTPTQSRTWGQIKSLYR